MSPKKKKPAGKMSRYVQALQSKFGSESALTVGGDVNTASALTELLSTGVDVLDHYVLGGGLPVGRMSEWFGQEGCIAGGAHIGYHLWFQGRLVNSKGGSLCRLHERFNNRNVHHLAGQFDQVTVPCVDDEGRVRHTRVTQVAWMGEKPCLRVTNTHGDVVLATPDHRFLTEDGYTRLDELRPGDEILVHRNTPYRETSPVSRTNRRAQVFVKHHPHAGIKTVGKYVYHRFARSRAVFEAHMNGLDLSTYLARLNSGELNGLTFLAPEDTVHHINEDWRDDRIENLRKLSKEEHNRHHAWENDSKLRFAVKPATIVSIEPGGVHNVYDISVEDPYRNFVANKFVVHNCGKTSLAYCAIAAVQRSGGVGVWGDPEMSFDDARARVFGVNTDDLLIVQPENLEDWFEQLKMLLAMHDSTEGPMLIAWDSIAAMGTKSGNKRPAGDVRVGDVPLLMSNELKKLLPLLAKHRAHLLALNQIRAKMGVMFGDNTTTPGGNAPKFYASQRVQFLGGKAVKNSKDEHTAKIVTCISVKNRLAAPWLKARVRLDYKTGFNNIWSTVWHAKRMKLIKCRADGFSGPSVEGLAAYNESLEALGWETTVPLPDSSGVELDVEADDDDSDDDSEEG